KISNHLFGRARDLLRDFSWLRS
ncbi:unnamed protein product, partial [Allacma fusca]